MATLIDWWRGFSSVPMPISPWWGVSSESPLQEQISGATPEELLSHPGPLPSVGTLHDGWFSAYPILFPPENTLSLSLHLVKFASFSLSSHASFHEIELRRGGSVVRPLTLSIQSATH